MSNEELIKSTYTNPRYGFQSAVNTRKKLKELHPDKKITLNEIKEVIKNLSTVQIHTQIKVKTEDYNPIQANQIGFFQMDLIDMSSYQRHNKNYRFILIMVDIKSRYSFMEKLKTKTAEEVYRAFLQIEYVCKTLNNRIYALYSDRGSEFKLIEKSADKYNYKMFYKTPNTHRGSGIVDNRIRFFRSLIEKYFTQNETLKWIDTYELINRNINNTVNRIIKEKPIRIWEHKAENKQEIPEKKPIDKFKIGQYVRLRKDTNNFTKNSTGLFSNKVYEIKEIDGLGMILKDYNDKVFPADVIKVNKPQKNKEQIEKIRKENTKKNKVKRILNKELN